MSESQWPTALDDLAEGPFGSARDNPSLADVINQLQSTIGISGAYNFVQLIDARLETLIRQNTFNQFQPPTAGVAFNSQRLMNAGTPAAVTDAPTALNSLIGENYYEPTFNLYTFTSASPVVPVDATNLSITFTAISTAVVIELVGSVAYSSGSGFAGWTLFSHGTTTQQGYWVTALANTSGTNGFNARCLIRVTGLSVGAAYQWDWVAATTGGTLVMGAGCGQGGTFTTGNVGPMIMRAFAA